MPVLYPASTGEFLTLGLHAIALSRFSGCWVAMKLVGSSRTAARRCTSRRTSPASSCRSS
jgi:TPP-dependent indolepyruvate ferredoxin oxidoreductase alpha subunit